MTPPIPSNYANAVAPFTPLGRTPVGQETEDLRGSTLRPLEQSAEAGRGENQRSPDQRPGEFDEAAWLDSQRTRTRESAADTREGRGGRGETVTLSGPGRDALASEAAVATAGNVSAVPTGPGEGGTPAQEQAENEIRKQLQRQQELEVRQEIRELAARDREVRRHEQAHAALGGRYAGAPQYEYERGPDGVAYAVSGEVPIDTSKVPNDPEATIEKAQQIRRAAYAPSEPSDTDRRVAAEAARMEVEARVELRQQRLESAEPEEEGRNPAEEPANGSGQSQAAERGEGSREEAQKEAREEALDALANEARRRNIDTYLQLVELSALASPERPGERLDQRV